MDDLDPKPNCDGRTFLPASSEDDTSPPSRSILARKRNPERASRGRVVVEDGDEISDIFEPTPSIQVRGEKIKQESFPRLVMAKPKISLSDPFSVPYHDILKKAKAKIEAEHSDFVLLQLLEASILEDKLHQNQQNFRDDHDQFADLSHIARPLYLSASGFSDSTQAGAGRKFDRNSVESVPRFKDYTRITQSFLVEDNCELAYEPYINEKEAYAESRFRVRLRDAYGPSPDPTSTRRDENASRLRGILPRVLDKVGLSREDIASSIAACHIKRRTNDTPKLPAVKFMEAFEEVFDMALEDVISNTEEGTTTLETSKIKRKGNERLEVAEKMMAAHLTACPLCGVHNCGAHGDQESSDDDETVNKKYCDLNMPFDSMLQCYNEKQAQKRDSTADECFGGEACSIHCFMYNKLGDNARNHDEWTIEDVDYLECLNTGMEKETRTACILAPLVGKSCWVVHHQLNLNSSTTTNPSEEPIRRQSPPPRLNWYDNKTKTMRTDKNWREETTTHLHESRRQPFGCDHKGLRCHEAKDQCHCFRENTLCDKFCSCSDDCHLRFTGCNCSKSGSSCSSNQETCVCRLLNRECDPDLCHTCGAIEKVNPFTRDEKPTTNGCRNTVIQRGIGVNLLIGESQVSGFGVILGEAVRRDQFIGEYVGEIISSEEADRRAIIYNKFHISYFFTLNESKVIDSYRFGNTTRFINHGRRNENCYVQVKLVSGEHRIGFFASEDLPAGTELFFDYGDDFLKSHKLRELSPPPGAKQDMKKRKDRMALGVGVEGEDADDDEDEDVDESALMECNLAAIPEYDTDEYEERGRGSGTVPRRDRRRRPSKSLGPSERARRRVAEKPVKYEL